MYATCLYCRSHLGANETIEVFQVGKRLAFDQRNGRLWVVCPACGRWNLSPLDERYEAIETAERLFRGTRARVTTDHIGLARMPDGTDLVRIGAPLRPEFAAWRYGRRFIRRHTQMQVAAGTAVVAAGAGALAFVPMIAPAVSIGALSMVFLPGPGTILGAAAMVGALATRDYYTYDRVLGRLHHNGRQITVRVKHLERADFRVAGSQQSEVSLDVMHDDGWARFDGLAAMQAASTLLAGTNKFGAGAKQVQEAVHQVEEYGDASAYLHSASDLAGARNQRMRSVLNRWRHLGAIRLSSTECLALEMSLHEESERRALEGELAILESAWRDAEELARVADGL